MTDIRIVLVPLDGSRFSELALPLAAEIAARSGASLCIARVHEPHAAWATALELPLVALEVDQELRQRERAYLDAITGQVMKDYRVTASSALLDGPTAAAWKPTPNRSRPT
jgi:nucleotide-binding universal stress UspA family protein